MTLEQSAAVQKIREALAEADETFGTLRGQGAHSNISGQLADIAMHKGRPFTRKSVRALLAALDAAQAAAQAPREEPIREVDDEALARLRERGAVAWAGYSGAPREVPRLTDEWIREMWSWSASREAERTASTQQHAFARAVESRVRELCGVAP